MAKTKSGNPVAKSKFARTDKVGLATMIVALKTAPQSYNDLVELTGFSRRVVAEWITSLRRKHLVYIASWAPDARRLAGFAEFVWDETMSTRDCKKPKRTHAEHSKRSREKKKRLAMAQAINSMVTTCANETTH